MKRPGSLSTTLIIGAVSGFMATACASQGKAPQSSAQVTDSQASAASNAPAIAVLKAAPKQKVSGTVKFTPEANGMRVTADIKGLQPNSTHGFHIHEFGDCSASDFTSAGGHFNPNNAPHGAPSPDASPDASTAEQHHIGDLGNLTTDKSGRAQLDQVFPHLNQGSDMIKGLAVIVHTKADDLKSQPTGDAGGRIGCGVIGISKKAE